MLCVLCVVLCCVVLCCVVLCVVCCVVCHFVLASLNPPSVFSRAACVRACVRIICRLSTRDGVTAIVGALDRLRESLQSQTKALIGSANANIRVRGRRAVLHCAGVDAGGGGVRL